ncbi:MAG: DUF1499 domain-containing protein [Nitriliruptoraceae bacterium]|nr:DUF1499 domain-containing protein [Nitriliruptoraceae bacterium]
MSEHRLSPCPSSPNCVSSQASPDDGEHHIEAISVPGGRDESAIVDAIVGVLEQAPRTRIAVRDGAYVHAIATSKVFRFKDDVEFLVDAAGGRIDVRSASRVGQSDLGVNRKRVEALRQRITDALT